ncbi:MAG: hypothetical protein KM312_00085 [Hydrogenibacillus schlegelii]|uniref:Uncharacterized protein n=1 Tax=Hydrogenibacillus schlegelii TaxID=1484 RepID=A0A947CV19_HYDSH|nr:hypothetical protein [Hydrogenibacillus schlegelii]
MGGLIWLAALAVSLWAAVLMLLLRDWIGWRPAAVAVWSGMILLAALAFSAIPYGGRGWTAAVLGAALFFPLIVLDHWNESRTARERLAVERPAGKDAPSDEVWKSESRTSENADEPGAEGDRFFTG